MNPHRSPRARQARKSPRPRRKAVTEVSAGGIIYTKRRGKVKVVLLMREHAKDDEERVHAKPGRRYVTWRLPKGHLSAGEKLIDAARREVAEETGVFGTGGPKLGTANFFFTHPVTKKFTHKYVHYFLFKKKTGSTSLHDKEHDDARWFTIPQALKVASFKNDQLMIKRAARLIRQRQSAGSGRRPRA